uniref:Uncharacterized protein n=2 Tax=Picea TaxID=3328 RepID=A0A117NGQ1_PICGL|nr:hypothetical protein ABT39_MTgene6098 [Picea glauca]QHR89937.1 hypothetical protein Q903MT_gene3959 [Picea sitchensis]
MYISCWILLRDRLSDQPTQSIFSCLMLDSPSVSAHNSDPTSLIGCYDIDAFEPIPSMDSVGRAKIGEARAVPIPCYNFRTDPWACCTFVSPAPVS